MSWVAQGSRIVRAGAAAAGKAPTGLRKMSGSTGVKRHPDLERWNNIRDNVDQVYDLSKPSTMAKTFVMAILIPVITYKVIASEPAAPNGDASTGVKFAPKSDTYTK